MNFSWDCTQQTDPNLKNHFLSLVLPYFLFLYWCRRKYLRGANNLCFCKMDNRAIDIKLYFKGLYMGISVYPLCGKRSNQHYNGRLCLFTKHWDAVREQLIPEMLYITSVYYSKIPQPQTLYDKCSSINYHKVGLIHCIQQIIERFWKVLYIYILSLLSSGPSLSIWVRKKKQMNILKPLGVKSSHIKLFFFFVW